MFPERSSVGESNYIRRIINILEAKLGYLEGFPFFLFWATLEFPVLGFGFLGHEPSKPVLDTPETKIKLVIFSVFHI